MGFNDISNTEWIWGHPQSVSQSDASYNFYYLDVVEPDSYNSFMADPHFKDTFTEGDIRLELFQWMREGLSGTTASSASVPTRRAILSYAFCRNVFDSCRSLGA